MHAIVLTRWLHAVSGTIRDSFVARRRYSSMDSDESSWLMSSSSDIRDCS